MMKYLLVVFLFFACDVTHGQVEAEVCVRLKAANPLGVPVHPAAGDGLVSGRLADETVARKLEVDDETGWIRVKTDELEGWITARYIAATFNCETEVVEGSVEPMPDDGGSTPDEETDLFPEMAGEELLRELRRVYSPTRHLSYREARQAMFGEIDNKDGEVRLVYTGTLIRTNGIPDHRFANTEHTWPQSRFSRAQNSSDIKSDIHHLYPTLNIVNARRANNPFMEIADAMTDEWWASEDASEWVPDLEVRDSFSESTDSLFEPREDHKGNVARSMFYIYVIYGDRQIDKAWFAPQAATLLEWNRKDPVDQSERERNEAVLQAQGNLNPFVVDPDLADRIFSN